VEEVWLRRGWVRDGLRWVEMRCDAMGVGVEEVW
jgi:hypothetical protein